jgi:hypothetical protein
MILNMFRTSLCSSPGGQLYIYSIWYRPTLYAAIQCTDQQPVKMPSKSGHRGCSAARCVIPLVTVCDRLETDRMTGYLNLLKGLTAVFSEFNCFRM